MSLSRTHRALSVAAAGCAVLATDLDARAGTNPTCSSLPGTIVYGAGGSSQLPLLAQIGTQLAALSPPTYVVYSSGSACAGYDDLATPANITGSADYWDGSGSGNLTCTLDAGGDPVTFAVMGNSPSLCGSGVTWPNAAIGQFLGPAQPLDFVVPSGSTQQSISTEAAYYIWGFFASDTNHTVSPWGTPANIFTRSSTSFVSLFLSLDLTSALGVNVPVATLTGVGGPDGGLFGTQASSTQATVTDLSKLTGTAAESGIGLVSGETADQNRDVVNILAYQHTGQTCGYWPDSTPQAFDKVNVRSGQYWLWSPVHFFAAVGDAGQITDPNTASFIGLFTGAATPPTGIDVFNAEVFGAFTVPSCAMEAWRDGDLSPPYSFAPPTPCSCKFDYATNNASPASTCTTCSQDSDCATNHCRNIGPPLPKIETDGGLSANPDAGAVGYCEAY